MGPGPVRWPSTEGPLPSTEDELEAEILDEPEEELLDELEEELLDELDDEDASSRGCSSDDIK